MIHTFSAISNNITSWYCHVASANGSWYQSPLFNFKHLPFNSFFVSSHIAKKQHRIPTNEDLLYDPNIDEDNQNWMNKQRAKYYPNRAPKRSHDQTSSESPSGAGNPAQPSQTPQPDKVTGATCPPSIPKTDAILNCPACMTTLCIDCQRHELYTNQYRAMFVMNCCIIRSEQLRYPESKNKKKKWRKKKRRHEETMEGGEADEEGSEAAGDELFNPVKCSICNTEVGVLDKQEIFHFFNVLSSAAWILALRPTDSTCEFLLLPCTGASVFSDVYSDI